MPNPTMNPDPKNDAIPTWNTVTKISLIIACLAIVVGMLAAPFFMRKKRIEGQTAEVSNLRQIGLALTEFESDYGTYPRKETAAAVTEKNPNHGMDLSGNSSNALFRQLIAAGYTPSESMFYAKVPGTHKPDEDISPSHALDKGEVAFGYISGLTSAGNPARPIAFAPIIPGIRKFDLEPFDGKAVFLRIDNSVSSYKILPDGSVKTSPGHDIFSPENPIWEGHTPDIRYPDL